MLRSNFRDPPPLLRIEIQRGCTCETVPKPSRRVLACPHSLCFIGTIISNGLKVCWRTIPDSLQIFWVTVYPPCTRRLRTCHADLCGTWDPEFHGLEKLGRAPRSIRGGQQTPIAGKFRSIPPAPQVGHQSQTGTIGKHGRCRRRPANSLLKPDLAFIAELFPRRPALLSRRPGHARPDATCRDDRDERDRRDGRDDTIRQT